MMKSYLPSSSGAMLSRPASTWFIFTGALGGPRKHVTSPMKILVRNFMLDICSKNIIMIATATATDDSKVTAMRTSVRPIRNRKRIPPGPWLLADYAGYEILNIDAFEWLRQAERNSIHAVVTDPPYGLLEYTPRELKKMQDGRGGVWRIPPSFDGCQRKPLPRFTVLTDENKNTLHSFIMKFADLIHPVLV